MDKRNAAAQLGFRGGRPIAAVRQGDVRARSAERSGRPDLRIGALLSRMKDLPPTLSIDEAAELCGIGRNAAYSAVHRGELPSLRFGRRYRVPTAPLLEMLGIEDQEREVQAK
jgi:excisionase family DNA binding protein